VDRVALINHGNLVAQGTPGALKARVGEGIRLEVWLEDGVSLKDEQLARLGALGTLRRPRAQQLTLIVPPEQIGGTVDAVLAEIGAAALADFRLATVSLEDVYVALVGRRIEDDEDDVGAANGDVTGPASPASTGVAVREAAAEGTR
jgi:ABC-2 type transport system ATP-binding protein